MFSLNPVWVSDWATQGHSQGFPEAGALCFGSLSLSKVNRRFGSVFYPACLCASLPSCSSVPTRPFRYCCWKTSHCRKLPPLGFTIQTELALLMRCTSTCQQHSHQRHFIFTLSDLWYLFFMDWESFRGFLENSRCSATCLLSCWTFPLCHETTVSQALRQYLWLWLDSALTRTVYWGTLH